TKAASELFITQPAVTKHINELEKQLDTGLFNRKGNSISLTPAGEVLLRYSRKIFDTYAALENELAVLNNINAGIIHIGASTTLAQTVLPKILALFRNRYPAVQFTFVRGNTDFITRQVLAEKVDIAIVEGSSHLSQLNYEPFMKDEIVLAARTGSRLAKHTEISPKELLEIPLVLREHGSGTLDVIFKALSRHNISPKELQVEIHLESNISIKQYLYYSECAAFLSIQSITDELKRNELSIIDIKGIDISRVFQFIHLQGRTSKLVDLFRRFCLANHNF